MHDASPYKPGAGTKPPYLAGRDELISTANKYLRAMEKGYPQKSVIYYGLQGIGKTVLLNAIEELADERGILYDHIEIVEKKRFLGQFISASKKMVHRMGLNEVSAYVTAGNLADDLIEMMVAMGRGAQKVNKSVCFFIDEIQYMKDDEMEALVIALHRVNQLGLPITLFGAGLPKVLKLLGEVKSYAERLFNYVHVDQLSDEAARDAIQKPAEDLKVSYTAEAVEEIIKWSKGYPYFIQELCNTVWEFSDKEEIAQEDVTRVLPTFLAHLDESFWTQRN